MEERVLHTQRRILPTCDEEAGSAPVANALAGLLFDPIAGNAAPGRMLDEEATLLGGRCVHTSQPPPFHTVCV